MSQSMQFGTGVCFGLPVGGNMGPNPTPRKFASLQDVQLDIAVTVKELRSQNIFPDDVAPAEMKITGKAKLGQIDGLLFNDLFFGQSVGTGANLLSLDELHSVPAATPYTVTIAPPSTGTFVDDLGVRYAATGQPFTKVSGTPAQGQYSASGDAYTFAAADASAAVLISYTYSETAGTVVTVVNQLQGYGPTFELWLGQTYKSQQVLWKLWSCRSSKLAIPTKLGDYTIPEFDFEAFPNAAGNVLTIHQQ